eukprot:TRINITY_DN13628_c0_g1_i1.p1 TRINITY_DN13628_c0_g1~~TRINITY_DN13628_c0_g1_i1.p1  ORF type:complete len:476 (+),score=57.93 TRINITY_DN13628_c0_g1_i1:3-1430(+)
MLVERHHTQTLNHKDRLMTRSKSRSPQQPLWLERNDSTRRPTNTPEEKAITKWTQRSTGKNPTLSDLHSAVFSFKNAFQPGELVLVPRTRGGFTYGRITGSRVRSNKCYLDPDVSHSVRDWRVQYPNFQQEMMYKDLLSSSIGKLQPFDYELDEKLICSEERVVSCHPTEKDLNISVLSPLNTFTVGDTVLVPRTNGGFTYGQILGVASKTCLFGEPKHHVNGWRVSISNDANNRSWKDMFTHQLGKIIFQNTCSVSVTANEFHGNILPKFRATNPEATETVDQSHRFQTTSFANVQMEFHSDALKYMTQPQRPKNLHKDKGMIVIDGPNIAMKHGKNQVFSVIGIVSCLEYWNNKGYTPICFVPEHFVTRKSSAEGRFADDVPLLIKLVNDNLVVLTPPQDYDDSYSIQYAKLHGACIVTNDMYRDHIEKQSEKDKARIRKWLRKHMISFTFVRDEFLPNPDFQLPRYDLPLKV